MTTPYSFEKIGAASDGTPVEEAALPNLTRIEFDLEFQQRSGGGLAGRFRNKFQPADPDLYVIAFQGEMPVDYVDPKDRPEIFDGAAANRGDARGNGVETGVVDVALLAQKNRDITGFAVAGACKDGFGRVAGIVCHVWRVDGGQRSHVTACRFDVTKPNITSGLFGAVVSGPNGWTFRKFNEYTVGIGSVGWQDMARAARPHMGS